MLVGTNDCERGGSVGNISGRYDEESKRICDANLFVPSQTLGLVKAMTRVAKSENFPDSKIFVATTFRIKRVNRAKC